MIRVWISASSPLVRAGLEALLQEEPRFAVMHSNAAGAGTLPHVGKANLGISETSPAVVLLEVASPDRLNSMQLFGEGDGRPIVLLADHLGRAELRRALHFGARAVLPRDATAPEIVAAIEAAAAGLTVLDSDQVDSLLPLTGETASIDSIVEEPLSTREAEVLTLMAEGLVNKEIATRLGISDNTVKFHVSSILGKLGATTRGEAVARGVRKGLITI